VKKYHPDLNPDPDAETQFQEIQMAYSILSDPLKRAQYDRTGHVEPERVVNTVDMRAAEVIRQSVQTILIGHGHALPEHADFIKLMLIEMDALVEHASKEHANDITTMQANLARLDGIIERISIKNPEAEDYLLPPLKREADGVRMRVSAMIADRDDKVSVMVRAKELLLKPGYSYRYRQDPPAPTPTPYYIPDDATIRKGRLW
jgi:hypothetical protein